MLNIQRLKKDIYDILYSAYMIQYMKNTSDKIYADDERGRKSGFEDAAKEFADCASGPVSLAIDKFVKDIGIFVTIPPSVIAPVTPILPGGPCSGSMDEKYMKIS